MYPAAGRPNEKGVEQGGVSLPYTSCYELRESIDQQWSSHSTIIVPFI